MSGTRLFCQGCNCELTEADIYLGCCTQCGCEYKPAPSLMQQLSDSLKKQEAEKAEK